MTRIMLTAALLATVHAGVAVANPVTDCPLRDAPFSSDSPLIDVLFSSQARAAVDRVSPHKLEDIPAQFAGTTTPTFAAILSVKEAAHFIGVKPAELSGLDTQLRKIAVTAQDKTARCARYDNDVPKIVLPAGKPRILLFEKITGFRDGPSVNAAHAAFTAMAQRKGWAMASTDKGGAITAATLRQFDAVIWNNISGDVLTLSQRRALKTWIENGGAFIAVHGSAGDPAYFWDWYADKLLGARFTGHPMSPQFQDAKIDVDTSHPVARGLPATWVMNDEWYSFRTNPRLVGAHVIATLNEQSYSPKGIMGQDLRMGADHPIAWTNCIGKGTMFYSAIGHRPETYSEPHYLTMLESAVAWSTGAGKAECATAAAR